MAFGDRLDGGTWTPGTGTLAQQATSYAHVALMFGLGNQTLTGSMSGNTMDGYWWSAASFTFPLAPTGVKFNGSRGFLG